MENIQGYAAVYYRDGDAGTEYELMPDLVERIRAGAFDSAIARGDDCIACLNHNQDLTFARVSNGTNVLRADDKGLHYTATPPDTQFGRDLLVQVERGDFHRSSFAFVPEYQFEERSDGPDIAWIVDMRKLYDVSPVSFPAYTGTTADARGETRYNLPAFPPNVSIRFIDREGAPVEQAKQYCGDVFDQYRKFKEQTAAERAEELAREERTRDARIRIAKL